MSDSGKDDRETPKADPTIYSKLRDHALRARIGREPDGAVQLVLMDWRVPNGFTTVLASADGSASIYLSSGGGYIGGGQKYPAIREAALAAIAIAQSDLRRFEPTPSTDLPISGEVYFYVVTSAGIRRGVATEVRLRDGTDALRELGGAMQEVITQYRINIPSQPNVSVQ